MDIQMPNITPETFPALVRSLGDKAYGFAYKLAGNEADARDLVQQAFTKAFENLNRFDTTRPFEPWFFRILKNIHLDWMRRYERKHSRSLEETSPLEEGSWEEILPSKEPEPIQQLERDEERRLVRKALESLPQHYRTALTLCDM